MRLVWTLTIVFIALQLADFYTTWACLHQPIPGWEALEINPISALLFERLGLVPGLVLDTTLGTGVIVWLARVRYLKYRLKIGLLVFLTFITACAVVNNYYNMVKMGIA